MYAVGRIPGGYLKREAKPSDHGILTARMIDRPIRPGFADGFKQEVHIVATPLVLDTQDCPTASPLWCASAALMCASAPFDGPAACVRIGRNIETGEFIVNPTVEEDENSDLELTIAGTADYISMVEAGAQEISEEDMLAAMTFGQEAIKAFCEEQSAFLAEVAPEPREWPVHVADPSIAARIEPFFDAMSAALKDADKHARMAKVDELKASIKENEFTEEERAAWGSDIAAELKLLKKHAMRAMVIETGERADGRTSTEIVCSTSLRAICLASMVLASSSVVRPKRFPFVRSVCSMNGSVSTPSGLKRVSATCISTTSRHIARVRLAAWVHRSAAKSVMVRSLNARSSRSFRAKMNSRIPSASYLRCSNRTVLPLWLLPAALRWHSWMLACLSRLPLLASRWASSRKATISSSSPISRV